MTKDIGHACKGSRYQETLAEYQPHCSHYLQVLAESTKPSKERKGMFLRK